MKGRAKTSLLMKGLTMAVSLAVVISLFPTTGRAAAPANIITYQGRLLDATGAEISAASISMSFAFYDALAAGTCLWSNSSSTCATTTARTVTLTNALFTENLGDTSESTPYAAISDSVFADNAAVYLEVVVGGETLSPRKRLTAAPYAVNAQTLDGISSAVLQLFEVGTNGSYEDDAAVIIGADAAFTHAGGASGDLRVADELEVIGKSYFDGIFDVNAAADFSGGLTNSAGEFLVSGGNVHLNDGIAMTFGSSDDLEITWDDTAAALELDGALVSIGDDAGGTTATGDNDLFVADALEVDGTLDADGQVDLGDGGDTFSVDSLEFDVSASTGAITINDGGDAGQISIEGTVLDINSLDFVGAGGITSGSNQNLTFTPGGNGDNVFALDSDSDFRLTLSGTTAPSQFFYEYYPNAVTLAAGTSLIGASIDLSTNLTLDAGGNAQTGLVITTTNGGAGTATGININGSPDIDIDLSNGETISNAADDLITFTGVGGTNNTSLTFDLDGATAAVPSIYSGNNDLININDGLSIGVNGDTAESISDTGFSIADGNDLYIADMLGVNGSAFFDSTLNIPDDTQMILGNGDDATISWVNATNDLLFNNNTATGSTIFQLGTDTNATDFQIQNDSASSLFSLDGLGRAIFNRNITNTASTINMVNIDFDQTYTGAGGITNTNNSLLITRDITMNSAGQTMNVSGNIVTISNTGTQTAGTLNEASNLLYLDQNYSTASSSVLQIDNGSTSPAVSLNQEVNGTVLYIDSLSTSANIFNVNISNTSGTLFKTAYGASTSLSTDLTAYSLDLQTSLTEDEGIDVIGFDASLPALTSNSAGGGTDTTIIGFDVGGGALHTDSADTITWSGFKATTPNITEDTTGTINSAGFSAANGSITTHGEQYGLYVTNGNITTDGNEYGVYVNNGTNSGGGTQVGLNVAANGVTAGYLYGVNISNLIANTGTEVALKIGSGWDDAINVNGSFVVETTGATDLETSLTIDAPATPGAVQRLCASTGGGDALALDEAIVVDCANAGQADYAEMYPLAAGITYGDVVVPGLNKITTEKGETIVQMVKSTSAYQNVFGGVVVNNYEDGTSAGWNINEADNPMPVSLAGRVMVHVTNEGGAIAIGDPLTTSSTAGYGMKANEPGMIIGYALNDFSGTSGEVMMFIHSGWYAGNLLTTDGSAALVSDTLTMASLGAATAADPGVASQTFALRGSGWDGSAARNLEMKIQTQVTDAANYRLSVRNTTDTEVAYLSSDGTMMLAGDLVVTGKFYPSDRGAAQSSKYIYYDGSAGPGGNMMRTNAAGWSTGSYDFAEMFPSSEALEAGDVVVFTTNEESIGRSSQTYDKKIAGVISTRPGFLAGENAAGQFPVALAGRLPTKVNLEGGVIAVGDPLTSSSTAGYAMKASEAGQIIGYALEPYGGVGDNKIIVFINVGYFNGLNDGSLPGIDNNASLLATGAAANFTSLNLEGGLYMGGNDVLNIGRLVGLANLWSIEADGTIKTAATIKTIITSYQNEKVETAAVTSAGGVFVTLVGTSELQNGLAVVDFEKIDPAFNDITSTIAPINIVVTPNGPVSLYVLEKNNNGFIINQINGADTGISVDWIATAYRKDYEPKEELTITLEETEATATTTATETGSSETEIIEPAVGEIPAPETTIEEETAPVIPEETLSAEETAASPIEFSEPTVEGDGGTETEPSSTTLGSDDSSTQTGG